MMTQTRQTIHKRTKKGQTAERLSALAAPLLAGLSAGTAVLLALIALIAYIFSRIDLPLSMMIPLATLSIGAAVFVASFTFVGIYGHGGLVLGALMGLILFGISCIVSAAAHTEFSQLTLFKAILMTLCGATGGFCGVELHEKRRKKHR